MNKTPLISVIVPTFNREKTITRTIDSLLRQSYKNIEIVIVEDGSEDATKDVLRQFDDDRIRVIYHEENKGVTAAKNTGLDNITGEWFTILDSDDEIISNALEAMINIPLNIDHRVTAVTCNCIDTSTGTFSGKGVSADQYLDFEKVVVDLYGEFWGLTKSELLLNDRLNEDLWGYENTLWYKINERANRYYLHQGLRIFHTEDSDRISNVANFSLAKSTRNYLGLSQENHYLETLKKYRPESLLKECLRGIVYLKADNKKKPARFYLKYMKTMKVKTRYKLMSLIFYNIPSPILRNSIKIWRIIK